MGNGRSAFVHTRVCISAPNLIFLRKTLFNTATALCHHPPLFSIHSRNVTPLPLSSIRLCIKRSLSFHGKTLPGILLTRYRSDYFTWIFDLNLPSPPLKFRLDPTQFSPRFYHVFSSFSLLFEGGGKGFSKGRVERLNCIAVNRAFCPPFHDDFFFHDIVSQIYTFFSSALQKSSLGRGGLPFSQPSRKLVVENVPWKYLVLKKGGWCRDELVVNYLHFRGNIFRKGPYASFNVSASFAGT